MSEAEKAVQAGLPLAVNATQVMDRLDLIEAAACCHRSLLECEESRRKADAARKMTILLARRIVCDPFLSDEDAIRTATPVALAALATMRAAPAEKGAKP